ncbi:MAG: hypothetical protein QXT45_04185 [Candidatus Bilamarchaeaceae archaeon]
MKEDEHEHTLVVSWSSTPSLENGMPGRVVLASSTALMPEELLGDLRVILLYLLRELPNIFSSGGSCGEGIRPV